MNKENKTILIKRFKSFLWRAGMGLSIGFLAFALDNIGFLELGALEVLGTGVLAYALSEVTKYLNSPTKN